jgi:hypothetical protein
VLNVCVIAGVVVVLSFALNRGRVVKSVFRPITTGWGRVTLIAGLLAEVCLVWVPYFSSVSVHSIQSLHPESLGYRLKTSIKALIALPRFIVWQSLTPPTGLQLGREQLSSTARLLVDLENLTVDLALGLVALSLALLLWRHRRHPRRTITHFGSHADTIFIAAMAIGVALPPILSPLLGGPWFHQHERPDQLVSLFPFFLSSVFGFTLLTVPRALGQFGKNAVVLLPLVYALISASADLSVATGALSDRRAKVFESDVPVAHKEQVVEFIAADWLSHGGRHDIAVDYNLVGPWTWLPTFIPLVESAHPGVYSIGRAFDYELWRRFGFRNIRTGGVHRTEGERLYVVGYAFEPPVLGAAAERVQFGKLRVEIKR